MPWTSVGTAATCDTSSSIMYLWGTADVGAASGDTVVLSMSFDPSSVTAATLASGGFGLATQQDISGNWTNAVVQNVGGTPAFHPVAWSTSAGHGLGDLWRGSHHEHRVGRGQPRRPIRRRALLAAAAATSLETQAALAPSPVPGPHPFCGALPVGQQPIHSRLVVSDQQATAHVEDGHPIRRNPEARGFLL